LVPELVVLPQPQLLDKLREVAHILRPLAYTILLCCSLKPADPKKRQSLKWLAWILSASIDAFAEWPQLEKLLFKEPAKEKTADESTIARDEKYTRVLKLLLYILREPFYSSLSKDYLNSVIETLEGWKLLRPFMGN
jgi:hypothetical protein